MGVYCAVLCCAVLYCAHNISFIACNGLPDSVASLDELCAPLEDGDLFACCARVKSWFGHLLLLVFHLVAGLPCGGCFCCIFAVDWCVAALSPGLAWPGLGAGRKRVL